MRWKEEEVAIGVRSWPKQRERNLPRQSETNIEGAMNACIGAVEVQVISMWLWWLRCRQQVDRASWNGKVRVAGFGITGSYH